MKRLMIIITITTLALLLSGCSKEPEINEVDKYFEAGISRRSNAQQAPDFTLKNVEGQNISLSDFKGEVVLLNFWASWCGPCVSEMPSIESLYMQTKDLNIKVIAVNLKESKNTVQNFLDTNNYTFETVLDVDGATGDSYGIRSIPTTYIINKDGIIVSGKLGAHEWDSEKIIEILKELAE